MTISRIHIMLGPNSFDVMACEFGSDRVLSHDNLTI